MNFPHVPAILLLLGVTFLPARVSAAPFDQAFIDAMVPHHESALMMAQMAASKALYAEVRSMARKMISEQQNEIKRLKTWRKLWYGSASTPGMMHHGMMHHGDTVAMPGKMMGLPIKGEMDMGKLRAARGREFDRLFLRMMIPHHAGAIMMADEALKVTGRKAIRSMSHQIIASQAREIGRMQGLLDRRF